MHDRLHQSGKDQINFTLVEFWELHSRDVHRINMNSYARIVSRKTFKDRHKKPGRNRFRASDPNLSRLGIGNEFDISNSLAQFVECRTASRQ